MARPPLNLWTTGLAPIIAELARTADSATRPLPAQADEVARSALVLVPRRKTEKLVGAQCVTDVPDLVPYRRKKRVVHRLTSGLALLVEVQHLDQVGGFASELLVSDGVN